MNMLVYGHKGSVVKSPLRPHVNIYFKHKGVMMNPL